MNLNLSPELVMMVSLTMAITQVYKTLIPSKAFNKILFNLLQKATPLVALICGILLSIAYSKGLTYPSLESGLLVGLTAAGVYSGGKTIIKKNKNV